MDIQQLFHEHRPDDPLSSKFCFLKAFLFNDPRFPYFILKIHPNQVAILGPELVHGGCSITNSKKDFVIKMSSNFSCPIWFEKVKKGLIDPSPRKNDGGISFDLSSYKDGPSFEEAYKEAYSKWKEDWPKDLPSKEEQAQKDYHFAVKWGK